MQSRVTGIADHILPLGDLFPNISPLASVQVIHGCFVNEGEVLTQKDVITNQGCLCSEGDHDQGKRMKQNLEKIDALLEIPYDGEIIRTAKARGRVAGMS